MATRYSLYSDNKASGATWSLAVGSADAAFPLTNLNSPYVHLVSKTTGTTATFRATISSTALQAISFHNCNLAGLTLAVTNNNSMASTNLVIPSAPADNLSIGGWVDLSAVTTAATQWNFAISGASANIAVGAIGLWSTLRTMAITWEPEVEECKPTNVFRTEYNIALGNRKAVRYRAFMPKLARESERSAYTNLRRGSEGPTQPFLFILDETVNDPAYCWFPEDTWSHTRSALLGTNWSDRMEEANPGLAL